MLWTFAVAQPLFDLLKDNPEFFAARGSSGFDVISLVGAARGAAAGVLLGIELLIGLAGGPPAGAHLVLIAGLVALIAAQALKKSIDASDSLLIVLPLAIGAGVAALFARAEPVRSFLRVLSPAPLVFLLFLFTDPISKVAFPDEAQARTIGGVSQAPIVVVLLDELPSNTLIGEHDKLDAKRFPGFGELARDGDLVPARLHRLRLDRARAAGDHGRQPARAGQAADLGRPPEQHLLAVRQEPTG